MSALFTVFAKCKLGKWRLLSQLKFIDGHQAVACMQISGQLATEGIRYNQSLAGTGGSAGAAAGCYTDERYVYVVYTSVPCQAYTLSSVCWKGLVGEELHVYL